MIKEHERTQKRIVWPSTSVARQCQVGISIFSFLINKRTSGEKIPIHQKTKSMYFWFLKTSDKWHTRN